MPNAQCPMPNAQCPMPNPVHDEKFLGTLQEVINRYARLLTLGRLSYAY
ncbi:MAG: hypothetical protein HC785_19410 [Calothrix sp. CSU_2_0]|nr:hypothetical protein [Calothrix sp. CSU_2_0]